MSGTNKFPGPKSGSPSRIDMGKRNGPFLHPGAFPEIGGATGPHVKGGMKRNELTVKKPGSK